VSKDTPLPSWLLQTGAKRKPFKQPTPVKMPVKHPACFASQRQYGPYKVLAQLTATDGFTFCTDCTSEYRDQMKAQGRCKYPDTRFVLNNGVVTGRRTK